MWQVGVESLLFFRDVLGLEVGSLYWSNTSAGSDAYGLSVMDHGVFVTSSDKDNTHGSISQK